MKNLPKLNPSYWILMLICTTMGELIGNLISRNFEFGYTKGALIDVCVFSILIISVLSFKLRHDFFYWLLILAGNIGGTNLADWVTLEPLENDRKWAALQPLQLGTRAGSLAVLGALVSVLLVRYVFVRRRGEASIAAGVLYWGAILISSTFGTTSGDFITNDTPLGAFGGSVALLVLLIGVFAAFRRGWLALAPAYWAALVLMHPVGATIGNYVSKPIGLNLGNVSTNLFLVAIFGLIFANETRARNPARVSAIQD
ncbi:MAG: hypothetical protein JST04_12110 [Bdellovibrionales bacterium]|nr:hypothetical protein [Bdellovibrionales bacterium]